MSLMRRVTHCLAAVAMGCLAAFGGRVEACMVCIPFPQRSVADVLLGAEVVVLARENPEQPFSYVAVEVLKGDLQAPEIDHFVNSTTRRLLALNPDRSVVLALGGSESPGGRGLWRPPSRDASPSTWRSLGYASPRYESIVREILDLGPRWREKGGSSERARYFMPHLADAESPIRELAYLEVGRAPYDTIREADRFVPDGQLRAYLTNVQYLEWQPLYILLLGIDATPEDEKTIRAEMAGSARFDQTLNLSAWATALIEIDGEAAIAWLERVYLGVPDRSPTTVQEVVKALTVHGAREGAGLRDRIAESYRVLLETHPSLAGWVARDLMAWSDWRLSDALEALRRTRLPMDGATAYAIDLYVGRARASASK